VNHTNFFFTEYCYEHSHYTDAGGGARYHYIGMLEEGNCRIVSADTIIEAGEGQPFYIPLDLSYQSWWFAEKTIRLRSCGFPFFPEAEESGYRLQLLPESLAEAVRSIPLMGHPDSGAMGRLFTVLSMALPTMERVERNEDQRLWERAAAYMESHPDCRVPEIAQHCSVSESTVYAVFRRRGSTPNRLRQELLVSRAVRLLTTTDISVQEISDRLNFSSASYFRKVLAQHTGQSPREIRRRAAKV